MNKWGHTSKVEKNYMGLIKTSSGLPVANGFLRVVHGQRGDYVEFEESQIIKGNLTIPEKELWRTKNLNAHYIEYRSNDETFAKIYQQRKLEDYADYRPGFWYISPRDLQDFEIVGRYD